MRTPLLAALLASVALPALAQTVATPVALTTGENNAVTTLIRQTERWLAQKRPDLAALSIGRALAAEPNNPAALLAAARVETARNNRDGALGYLRRAEAVAGTDEQRNAAAAALRSSTLDQTALEAARRSARDGRADEAAARYRALFGIAGLPPEYAREYYQVLAGSGGTRAEGLAGLGRMATAPNADADTKLAAAEALTYQEGTRAEGIGQLAQLAGQPATAAAAQRSWRQALGFLGADPAAAPLIAAYLNRFPGDTELSQRLATLRAAPVAPVASPGDALRREGFAQLENGALQPSAARFTAALAVNPNDADALGGLGLVRLRENKPDEARPLLEHAIAADPARAAQWQKALDGAAYGAELVDARKAIRGNDIAGADALLRQALRRDVVDRTDAESMLGEVALRQSDPAAAEQHFRTALSRRPGFPPAATGLNQALRAQGKPVEAPAPRSAVVADNSASTAPSGGGQSSGRVGELRSQAAQVSDGNVAITLLRSAMELAPSDPWVRLDLARAMKRQGRGPEGRALVEELAARDAGSDGHLAAALFAQEDGRLDDAEAQIALIPPNRRTPDMTRLSARLRTDRDVGRAAAAYLADPASGRQQLMLVAARPDPSGATGAAVIRTFGDAGDRAGAVEASRVAIAANGAAGPAARLAIAGGLLGAGADAEANTMADQLSSATLTGDQRRDLASLRTGVAIRASDKLNENGAQAQAFERLRPVLAQDPDNVEGQLALARLYQGARQPAEALRLATAVLAHDSRNFAARQGAVEAAMALGDRRTASLLVTDGQAAGPTDSRLLYLQARVAGRFGDSTRSQALLQQALEQRRAELGTTAGIPVASGLANPFQTAGVTAAGQTNDPVSKQILHDLAASETASAPLVAFAPTVHTRSGSAGLDQLAAIGGTIETSAAAPGIGGRITARAEPVMLNSGQLGGSLPVLYRFGTNPLLGTTPVVPKNVTATGVGLSVAYALSDQLKLSLGTTPLSFRSTNVIGGFEFAPKLSDNLRLRVTGDRHAMTDSLLSWAGLTDPASHVSWGSVVSTGGRAQIEGSVGAGSAYVGGGYAVLNGLHVASNNRTEGGAGFSYPVFRQGDGELTAGLDLVYFSFANNQRAFTLGNGGYFSPQTYGAMNIPIDYRAKSGDFSYRVGATVGYASFKENTSPVFPHDPTLQAQLVTAAASNPLLSTRNPSLTRNGFVGGVRVELAYQLTPAMTLSGAMRYDQAPQFDETNVQVRLESKF